MVSTGKFVTLLNASSLPIKVIQSKQLNDFALDDIDMTERIYYKM